MYKITSSSFVELRELNHLSRTSIEEEKFLSRNLFIYGYNDTNNKVWLRNQSSIFFFFYFPSFSIRSSDINDQQKQRDESTRETEIQRMGKYTVNDRSCIFVSGYNTHL